MRRSIAVLTAVLLVPPVVATSARATSHPRSDPSVYLVGAASESINPTAAMLHDAFHLGGYGFGSTEILGQALPDPIGLNREATGSLGTNASDGHGPHSRAMAIGDGTHVIELAQIETQGYFAAYKQGPFGIEEIRKDAAIKINALRRRVAITAGEILVDSDHSHGGADTVGVWGGVPTSYLKLVHDRTVEALVSAYQSLKPTNVYYGVAHAGVQGESARYPAPGGDALITNQFSNDPANQAVDDELRVLQFRAPGGGKVLGTYLNFSAHPTVLDSNNTFVTADYPGVVSDLLARSYGGFGFDQVATLGRTQPARAGCVNPLLKAAASFRCALDQYAGRVVDRVALAVRQAKPLTGAPIVNLQSYLITDVTTNPVLLGGAYAGTAIGAPIDRAINPPWFTGNIVGMPSYSGRIGDILISGGPGEMYPQIVQKVRNTVRGMRGYLNIGTAGDFLGYFISPLGAYPEPIRRSILSGDPPPKGGTCFGIHSPIGCPDPIGNDNYFFNISYTVGDRVTCSLLRGAGDVLAGDPRKYWSSDRECLLFADDLAKPKNLDTQFPEQPDLSAVLPH